MLNNQIRRYSIFRQVTNTFLGWNKKNIKRGLNGPDREIPQRSGGFHRFHRFHPCLFSSPRSQHFRQVQREVTIARLESSPAAQKKNYSPATAWRLIEYSWSHFGVAWLFWTKSKQKPNLAKTPKGPVETTNCQNLATSKVSWAEAVHPTSSFRDGFRCKIVSIKCYMTRTSTY